MEIFYIYVQMNMIFDYIFVVNKLNFSIILIDTFLIINL